MNSKVIELSEKLIKTLKSLKIDASIQDVFPGPVITIYDIILTPGTKIQKVKENLDKISLAMKTTAIRIEKIPQKDIIRMKIPNTKPLPVNLKDIIDCEEFKNSKSLLTWAVGTKSDDSFYITNLEKMPHLLIAGTDKTEIKGCINTIILSILYKSNPNDVKFVLIDTKNELSVYKNLPHIYNYCSEKESIIKSLKKLVEIMEKRYEKYASNMVRNIKEYNDKMLSEGKVKDYYIVCIMNDLADFMIKPSLIVKLAQMSRNVGIHLIAATNTITRKVLTHNIKFYFLSNVSFKVNSAKESKLILDSAGAEKLVGNGDMLFYPAPSPRIDKFLPFDLVQKSKEMTVPFIRIQCPIVSSKEIEKVINFINSQNFQKEDNDNINNLMQKVEKESIINKNNSNVNETIEVIQEIVAQEYNITVKDLKSKKLKTTEFVLPRQIAMYLAKTMILDISTVDVGNAFEGRDHITVMHAFNKIKEKIDNDPFFNALIIELTKKIKKSGVLSK